MKHGKLRLSGIGLIQLRGKARTEGAPKTCEILHKSGKWYASVTVQCIPKRARGTRAAGFDWGVSTFATVAYDDGTTQEIENPRPMAAAKSRQLLAERSLARKQGPPARPIPSRGWVSAKHKVSRITSKVARQRKDFLHKQSAILVANCSLIAGEELEIPEMTKSAKGTKENPGKKVKQKSGLNRAILDTAPGMWHSMLRYKAEEAGATYVESPTKELKPTQRCHACWSVAPKKLSERVHSCGSCGVQCGRDVNAARVNLKWAIAHTGWEPSCRSVPAQAGVGRETPSIAR